MVVAAGAALCGASIVAGPCAAMPMSRVATPAASANVQTVADDCSRYRCWWGWPSYYDTPPHLRPRVFYGYAPHRDGDWFWYLYGRDRYRKDWVRW